MLEPSLSSLRAGECPTAHFADAAFCFGVSRELWLRFSLEACGCLRDFNVLKALSEVLVSAWFCHVPGRNHRKLHAESGLLAKQVHSMRWCLRGRNAACDLIDKTGKEQEGTCQREANGLAEGRQ